MFIRLWDTLFVPVCIIIVCAFIGGYIWFIKSIKKQTVLRKQSEEILDSLLRQMPYSKFYSWIGLSHVYDGTIDSLADAGAKVFFVNSSFNGKIFGGYAIFSDKFAIIKPELYNKNQYHKIVFNLLQTKLTSKFQVTIDEEISTTVTEKKNSASVVGGAVAGAVVAGGVGAVVGAVAAHDKNQNGKGVKGQVHYRSTGNYYMHFADVKISELYVSPELASVFPESYVQEEPERKMVRICNLEGSKEHVSQTKEYVIRLFDKLQG